MSGIVVTGAASGIGRASAEALVAVNAVCPGFIQTPMLQMALDIDEVRAGFEQACAARADRSTRGSR
jgi:NAD(P)-dependent dehydrogenase (short-subunit alcohol dehydrogenase family)